MRKLLVSAAIIGLIASFPPAFAQDREHHDQAAPPRGGEQHGGPPGGGAPHGAPPGPRPAAQPQPQRGGPPRGAENRGQARPEANRPAPNNAMSGPEQRPASNNAMRPNPPPNNAMRGPQGRPGPNNAMRGPSRDFSSARNYHQNFNATRRFRGPAYVRPSGYYARRWTWGMTLPALFWSRQYWLMDYEAYDLPPPPIGAVWVRVGDDALLIDQYSGGIIEVDYGVFY